jgi:hypothetical protein
MKWVAIHALHALNGVFKINRFKADHVENSTDFRGIVKVHSR